MQDGDSVLFWSPSKKARKPIRCRGARYFANPDIAKLALPNPFRPGEKGPSQEVVDEIDALLEAGGEHERVVEVPESLIPAEFRTGLSSGASAAASSGSMKLEKKNAEGIAPPKPSKRAAGIPDDEWGDSVAVPDMSDLMASIERGDDREDDRFPDHADDRIPPDADFSGDKDDEPV